MKPGRLLLLVAATVIFVSLLLLLLIPVSHEQRLQPSSMNRTFPVALETPFSAYLQLTEAMVRAVREQQEHIAPDILEFSIDANTPYELQPAAHCPEADDDGMHRRGILLVHGLTDSPYSMRALAEHLSQRCFLVRTLLMPGHGTIPGDLLTVHHDEWVRAVEYGLHHLSRVVHSLYMGGFSTGGTLSVRMALEGGHDLQGIVLLAPAIAIDSPFSHLLPLAVQFRPWLRTSADLDAVKYESFALNGALQVFRLIQHNDRLMRSSGSLGHVPVFLAISMDDATVSAPAAIRFFQEQAVHDGSRLLLFQKSSGDQFLAQQRTHILNSYLPQRNIYHFSHVSLPYHPDDRHYGVDGRYVNCLHYRAAEEEEQCRRALQVWSGEVFVPFSQEGGYMRRLTYNPRFGEMMDILDLWLEQVVIHE
ncbi:alpha/beta hydrolase [Desulfurispirillum indicum]|uniref:alpha/beta hydrolase n=1 Tax=Desulfurispirillum indicum TaxID=936456 RepID=UPI001CFA848E|nr:alpha/beta fold hydrolase [Desulfurispirillum indicum]UCZ55585.1 alpha/beta hydrolase [Desulfurispirillum indicum]